MNQRPDRRAGGRIFWGLFLVLIGVLFLLDHLGMHDFGYTISRYWPVVLILLGLSMLIGNGFRRIGPGAFLIILGSFFLLRELGFVRHDAWHYVWPALLIAVGLSLLLRPVWGRPSGGPIPPLKDSDFDIHCVFSGMARRIDSPNLKGGKASASFGGLELDLTGATLEGGQAVIDASASFGSVEIRVPRDWKVEISGAPVLGGFNEEHTNPAGPAKATLYIRASAVFGAVTVKN